MLRAYIWSLFGAFCVGERGAFFLRSAVRHQIKAPRWLVALLSGAFLKTQCSAPPAPLPSHKSSRQILAIQLAAAEYIAAQVLDAEVKRIILTASNGLQDMFVKAGICARALRYVLIFAPAELWPCTTDILARSADPAIASLLRNRDPDDRDISVLANSPVVAGRVGSGFGCLTQTLCTRRSHRYLRTLILR
jgi:hypothetical protein